MQGAGAFVRGGSDGRPGLVLWDGDVVVRRVILGAAIREIISTLRRVGETSGGRGFGGWIWDVEVAAGCGSKDLELSTEYARSVIGLGGGSGWGSRKEVSGEWSGSERVREYHQQHQPWGPEPWPTAPWPGRSSGEILQWPLREGCRRASN